MIKEKYKKSGSVMITMLFVMVLILIVVAVVISHLTSVETAKMAKKSAQIIAETRALAIDTPLKEHYGYVEVLHEPYVYETPFPVQPVYNQAVQGYERMVLRPDHPDYIAAVEFADRSAKQAGIAYLEGTTGTAESGNQLINVEPENICIGVYSLPDEVIDERKVGCGPITMPNDSSVKAFWETRSEIPIYGSKHRLNGFSGQTGDLQNDIQNYNYVFVLVTYQEQTMFYKTIQRFAHGSDESEWTPPPTKAAWAVAYPQADFCTGADC